MKLNLSALQQKQCWLDAGYSLPSFDVHAIAAKTVAQPAWLHLGAGNLFRAFPAAALRSA